LKLLVDIYKTNDLYSGLGQYSLNFANELIKYCPMNIQPNFLIPGRFSEPRAPGVGWIKTGFWQRFLPDLSPKADIWHSLHQFPSHLPHPQSKVILTVHDLNFLQGKTPSKIAKYLKRLQKNVDRASAVTVVSDHTGKILQENIDLKNKPLLTIHDGVRLEPRPGAPRPKWLQDKPFFFSLSVFKESKNFHTLVPLMEHFPDHILVLGGNNQTAYGERMRELIRNSPVSENIILAGTLSEDEKYWLYKHCRAFLFPSLAEGFGLPVIEAMLAGKQVFLSRMGSLPETGGVLGFYWDNFDAEEMAFVLRKGLELREKTPGACSEEIKAYASRYNWENCIQKFIDLYQSVLL
jgi:glycosyltransferase involved in cell wall biosynthesis